jgi:hypothetical protein
MFTNISKVLTVFMTSMSVLFMGVALAIHSTGPNWEEDIQKLPDYTFKYTPGESPTWSVSHRLSSNTPIATSPVLPAVIAKAYAHQATRNQAEQTKQEQPVEGLKAQILVMNATVEVDKKALTTRITQLTATMVDVDKKIAELDLAGDQLTKDANANRLEARDRREDKNRLLRQLQQIEADQFHLQAQKRRLLDTMFQLKGELRRLQIRNRQLIEQGATIDVAPTAQITPDSSST